MHTIAALTLSLSAIMPIGQKVIRASIDQGIDPMIAIQVVKCESGFRTDAVGDHGLAYGPAQFHEPTFKWLKKIAGAPELEWKDPDHQIALMVWAIANGYGSHWSCYNRLTPDDQPA